MVLRNLKYTPLAALLALSWACGNADRSSPPLARTACTVAETLRPLPEDVRETSGLAMGRRNPGVIWTHNDSGFEPFIYALDPTGAIKAFVRIKGVVLTDWEDMEAGDCEGASCLYIADIGDNAGARSSVLIYEVLEPELTATEATPLRTLHARYPDGAQDAEAFFRLPSGAMYIVTKGRHGAIKLYRYDGEGAGELGVLELVREVLPHPEDERDRVTAATASPDGKWVAVRTYRTLYIYRTGDLTGGGAPMITYSLTDLKEKQGESLTLSNDGVIWLTSEAEDQRDMPMIARLSCVLE